MRCFVVFLWTLTLGRVIGCIDGVLPGGSYDFKMTTILSLVVAVVILLVVHSAVPKGTKPVK